MPINCRLNQNVQGRWIYCAQYIDHAVLKFSFPGADNLFSPPPDSVVENVMKVKLEMILLISRLII